MSTAMNIPLLEISIKGRSLYRYIKSSYLTYLAIRKDSVKYIFFQNPSLVLSVFIVLCNFGHRKTLIMDAHNAGIRPLEGKSKVLNLVAAWVVSKVDITIVTNAALASAVRKMSGNPFVLTDPIPKFPSKVDSPSRKENVNEVVLICTWAKDEPYQEVIESANYLKDESVLIRITGRPPKSIKKEKIPDNVSLEGFISSIDYHNLLMEADLIVDLTTRDDCLVCGAYESVAAGTPCVVSSSAINREIFDEGFIFTENDAQSIAFAIRSGLNRKKELSEEIKAFRQKYTLIFSQKIDDLISRIF